MPFPIAAAVAGGAGLASSAINALSTARQNRLNRQWTEERYNIEKADALSFWNTQNEYNSPAAQMQRLKAAGLNPNLVYGGGANAMSGPIKGPSTGSYQGTAPKVDIQGPAIDAINTHMAYTMQGKQLQVMDQQLLNLQQDNNLKQIQAIRQMVGIGGDQWQIERSKTLFPAILENQNLLNEAQQANIQNTITQTGIALRRDEREALSNSQSIAESMERIISMRAQRSLIPYEKAKMNATIQDLKSSANSKDWDSYLKSIEAKFREKGINPNGPIWERAVGKLIDLVIEYGVWDGLKKAKELIGEGGSLIQDKTNYSPTWK